MPQFDMKDLRHLWVTLDVSKGDRREVIIDKEKDVRVCDGVHVVKVRFRGEILLDVLVDDVFVWRAS